MQTESDKTTVQKGHTAPKGRPTAKRSAVQGRRGLSATAQWAITIVCFVAVILGIFYAGRNFRGDPFQNHGGLEHPTPVEADHSI